MILKLEGITTDLSMYLSDKFLPDRNAVEELQQAAQLEHTISTLKKCSGFFADEDVKIEKIIVTPDFHKGAGIPIGTVMLSKGFVVPSMMGNDINCGMRVYTTDLKEEKIQANLEELAKKIRYLFFEGGRNIPMTGIQREAILKEGLLGLLSTSKNSMQSGLWQLYDANTQEKQLDFVAFQGSLLTEQTEGLEDFIGKERGLSYDDQIGSIGGGNHFVEIQKITDVYDGQTANAWHLKKGDVLLMLHTGSLTIGHHSGLLNKSICKELYPKAIPHPSNKIYPIPCSEKYQKAFQRFLSTTHNAANFAFANRMFLGLMLQKALFDTIGEHSINLLYDSPHNFIWKKQINGTEYFLHRKGACSANGMLDMVNTPFAYYGEPVMIPGSMGGASYLLRGLGNPDSLCSASHGAGRRLSRGEAIHGNDDLFQDFMKRFHIVTPIDPTRNDIKGRKDILAKWEETVRAEAPYAYKNVDDIIKVHTDNHMADLVAKMEPILTIKS